MNKFEYFIIILIIICTFVYLRGYINKWQTILIPGFPLKLKLTQAPSDNRWSVTSVNVEVNGVNQVHTINPLGTTTIELQQDFVNDNNKIKISNNSSVIGDEEAGVHTWDLYEIELFSSNNTKIPLFKINSSPSLTWIDKPSSNLTDGDYNTFWTYNPNQAVTDLDGNPVKDVDKKQWVEFEFSLISPQTVTFGIG